MTDMYDHGRAWFGRRKVKPYPVDHEVYSWVEAHRFAKRVRRFSTVTTERFYEPICVGCGGPFDPPSNQQSVCPHCGLRFYVETYMVGYDVHQRYRVWREGGRVECAAAA